MDFVDVKYINSISIRLSKFKKVKSNLYNFRCPLCGDSQKQKSKARGYFYGVKADVNFKCHNCGASMTFSSFLKELDSTMHRQYVLEKFKDGHTGKASVVEEPKFEFKKPVFKKKLDLPKASEVPDAKEYLDRRKLDSTKFYYTDKFREWTNTQKQTFDYVGKDERRIIIPMYNEKNNLIGFQGRSLDSNSVKYITIMLNEGSPKIYGLNTIDRKSKVYVVEGPFDSNFLSNSVALCGSDGDVVCLEGSSIVFVYDNEPRNKEIVARIDRCIERGDSVVIWPNNVKEKDINDMVLSGHNVQEMVESNTYHGLEAKLKFTTWKRI
jgi:predicted RNA-binding Zn-ribbon protein involved in translation (DUF1610 family)|tara:strand:- start:93 stop:1064 length:972 start_codon:yes stop_codon:yes gene_type:complete